MKLHGHDFSPLPGKSVVKMERLYNADTGSIELPEFVKRRITHVGVVIESKMRERDCRTIGTNDLVGCRVFLGDHAGVMLDDVHMLIPNSYEVANEKYATPFLAILPKDFDFDVTAQNAGTDEAPRCKHCGPADARNSQQNVIMQPHSTHGWYCPRCNKNRAGDVINPTDYAMQTHSPELLRENQVKSKLYI